jgi:hypothetical protein
VLVKDAAATMMTGDNGSMRQLKKPREVEHDSQIYAAYERLPHAGRDRHTNEGRRRTFPPDSCHVSTATGTSVRERRGELHAVP